MQSFEGLGAADLPQSSSGSRRHLGVVIRQELRQGGHGPRLAPEPKRVDDAGFGQPRSLPERVSERLASFGRGHGFQRIAGGVGELLIGEQRRERRDRLVGPDAFKLGAGGILFPR